MCNSILVLTQGICNNLKKVLRFAYALFKIILLFVQTVQSELHSQCFGQNPEGESISKKASLDIPLEQNLWAYGWNFSEATVA